MTMLTPAQPNDSRSRLRFEEAVLGAFAFMITDFGYRVVESVVTRVRYESAAVFVNVFHGRSSYEIGVEIGPQTNSRSSELDGEERYSLWDICLLEGAQGVTTKSFLQASTPDRVLDAVEKAAALLKEYGGDALRGDPSYFARLGEAHTVRFHAEQSATLLQRIQGDLDAAWGRKDFAAVVALLEGVPELPPRESRRLEYARSHVKA